MQQHPTAAKYYAKVLLSLFGVSLSACCAAFPVIKQAAPDGYMILAYGLLVVLALVLLTGLLATSFEKSPSSVVWGKYALQVALGLTIGFLTWSVCSLSPTHEWCTSPSSFSSSTASGN